MSQTEVQHFVVSLTTEDDIHGIILLHLHQVLIYIVITVGQTLICHLHTLHLETNMSKINCNFVVD